MPRAYASQGDLKSFLGISDTTDDALLLAALEDISEEIDAFCHRTFQPRTATRYYTAKSGSKLLLPDDLLAVTSLKELVTNTSGTRSYGAGSDATIAWGTTDYDLYPLNAVSDEQPYWEIRVNPEGDYDFPTDPLGVQLVGIWGYWRNLVTVTSLLNEALDASETGVDVDAGTDFSPGQTLLVESEQLYVTAVATNTLTVERGVNGTTAATHANDTAIQRYRYPRRVVRATLVQAQIAFRQKDGPFAVFGGGEFNQEVKTIVAAGLHPFVRRLLNPLRKGYVAA